MKYAVAFAFPALFATLCASIIPADVLAAGAAASALDAAWTAWGNGDVADAETVASAARDTDARRHVLFLCTFVTGRYDEALEHYRLIRASYPRFTELAQPVVEAYLHLGRYAEAERFAGAARMDEHLYGELAQRAAHPLRVTLHRVAEIPFADHRLAEFFPAVEAEIDAQPVLVHVDTGGTFLHMNLDRARELGIDLTPGREGRHGTRAVQTYRGIAETFRLGDVLLENVPVVALPSLTGRQDFIMFGTNILQQFLGTLDYPAGRLILSPRRD
ncbi:MAG: aspartyl protease family protein, partial [Armatimonadota bacterium]